MLQRGLIGPVVGAVVEGQGPAFAVVHAAVRVLGPVGLVGDHHVHAEASAGAGPAHGAIPHRAALLGTQGLRGGAEPGELARDWQLCQHCLVEDR